MYILGVFYILIALSSTVIASGESTEELFDFDTEDTSTKNLTQCYFSKGLCVNQWNCTYPSAHTSKYMINLAPKHNCDYLEICCGKEYIVKNYTRPTAKKVECGYANPSGVLMTIKGDNQGAVNFGAYPWTVAIFDTEYEYRCAGALIHFQVVLTTGFCLGPVKTKLIARAGEWDMNTIEEILPNEEISEYTKIYHSKFDKYSEEYNIGLLILNKEFTALPHIQTVCLPIEHTKVVESDCLTTGWEKYSRGRRVFLQKNLMNISNELCSSKPNSNIFCASSQEEGVEWALGSSLVCPWVNSENRYSIRGLWISEAGKVNKPTYFLNVTKFTPWIIEELKNKNINVST